MNRIFIIIITAFVLPHVIRAQLKYIPIESKNHALVLEVTVGKSPRIVYFGQRIADSNEYSRVSGMYKQGDDYSGVLANAYTTAGTRNLVEPAISVIHADGNTSLDLFYVSSTTTALANGISLTKVVLKDPVYPVNVTLFYKVYNNEDVIEQWAEIIHSEKTSIRLQKFASANLYLKGNGYWLRQFHGDWLKEMQPEEMQLTHGIKTLDSKLGSRANLYQPSVFAIGLDGPIREDEGKVLLANIEWSGNFRVDLEVDPMDNLRLIAGINNYLSDYLLKPSEKFTIPPLLYALSTHGAGEASRNLQRWARQYRILDGNGSRLSLLNNWETTLFNFDEARLAQMLKDTKKLGVDLFLLDDGWFGNKYPRNNDRAGLGDWQENKQKLPNGLGSLVKEAAANGVKFGLWLEPEMVNPQSELNQAHPDWVIRQPRRAEFFFRNQLVLDLANPKVQDFIYDLVDGLFTKNKGLAYIKWDCNAVIYNAYSTYLGDNQSHFYIDYVHGLYKVLQRIRTKYPLIPMMLCSGGGGRVDYNAFRYFTEFWPSDNTDPLDRVFIQWEYSYFFPAITSANHVTDMGKQPLKFKTDVAMMGKFGFDIAIERLNPVDLAFCQQAVGVYKQISELVWHGDQYRLLSPWKNDVASLVYCDSTASSAVMFNYLVGNRHAAGTKVPMVLKGLRADKKYRITELNLTSGSRSMFNTDSVYSGDFLMTVGINPQVNATRSSVILKIDQIK